MKKITMFESKDGAQWDTEEAAMASDLGFDLAGTLLKLLPDSTFGVRDKHCPRNAANRAAYAIARHSPEAARAIINALREVE